MSATSLRARVKAGRLVLDEPTSLPDGTEVELVAVNDIDDLEPADRARLDVLLAESIRGHRSGTGISADELLAELGVTR